jgi:hypothetical protein
MSWIKCSDRMPPPRTQVLFVGQLWDIPRAVFTGELDHDPSYIIVDRKTNRYDAHEEAAQCFALRSVAARAT